MTVGPRERYPDDELVFTLSDRNSVDSEASDSNTSQAHTVTTSGSHRKRRGSSGNENTRPRKTRIRPFARSLHNSSSDLSASENDNGEQDGAIDPEFEFEVGASQTDAIVDFDSWEISEPRKVQEKRDGGKNSAVDIDKIIERRQSRFRPPQSGIQPQNGLAKESSDIDGEGGLFPTNGDDELLAEDGFGMGVVSADEESESDGQEVNISKDNGAFKSQYEPSIDGSEVASPTAHPDDLGSGSSSDSERGGDDVDEKQKQTAFFAPDDNTDRTMQNEPLAGQSFHDFSLSRPILKGIAAVGFSSPTPIQTKTIPVALLGKDVVGGAVTGSGKTAAFIIPILERLLYRPRKIPTSRVAILMPTRELAVQCFNVATKLAIFTDISFCRLVGGFSLREQESILKKRPDVIIATPGRFIDHMRNSASFTIDTLEILILDEADRMLEDGFADELNEILSTIPKSRQTMLFSATMTDSVDKLIRLGLNRPVRLLVDAKKQTVGTLTQEFVRLRPGKEEKRLAYLVLLCQKTYTNRVIVFFRQKKVAHRIRIVFGLLGLKAAELHGSMSQEQRLNSVESFRSGKVSFLLATDVASRGLDIKGVETVLNYEAPQNHEIYLHRVGRTARAGRIGRSCTIAAEPDRKVVKAAVKSARAQGGKVVSRSVDSSEVDQWAQRIEEIERDIKAVLDEEKEERQLAQAEMQVNRGDNLIKHQDEILSRPKRTWFESEKDKMMSKKAGLIELNGPSAGARRKKGKLSGKDKKRLDNRRERLENGTWKKKTAEVAQSNTSKSAKQAKKGRR
ncbi:MAG: hypothetical protein Q9160_000490 [Pyrenula sp. 1 TL-2023]